MIDGQRDELDGQEGSARFEKERSSEEKGGEPRPEFRRSESPSRWTPLAYELEQRSGDDRETRGEVF
jgi:hypothetical protein